MNGLIKKAGLGVALAATALTAAAPADAQRYRGGYRHYNRGGGDVAAGAILGGIVGLGVGAAIANSGRDRYYDRGYGYYDAPPPPRAYYDRGYGYGYGDRYDYRPSCYSQWRWDPYYARNVRVRVCN